MKNYISKKILLLLPIIFVGVHTLAMAQSINFDVVTSGSSRIVSTDTQINNCSFPIALKSVNGSRDENSAESVFIDGNTSIFVFNHPVETNREEVSIRRVVDGCQATFTITNLVQPVSQFSLVTTPIVGAVSANEVIVWEHISLGPLPQEPQSPTPNIPDEPDPSDDGDGENAIPGFCQNNEVQDLLNRIGVLSEEIRIQENRLTDLASRQEIENNNAWQIAENLVETRSTITSLEINLINWQERLSFLVAQLEDKQNNLNKAHEDYKALQQKYVDDSLVKVSDGEKPLDEVSSGITISLDGGRTWLVLVGQKGLRKFINEIRNNKEQGRNLHRQGQAVKQLQSEVYNLSNQRETAENSIKAIEEALQNAGQNLSTLTNELSNSRSQRTTLLEESVNAGEQLQRLQNNLEEEYLLLNRCDAFQFEDTSFINNLFKRIVKFFNPLVLAYGGK